MATWVIRGCDSSSPERDAREQFQISNGIVTMDYSVRDSVTDFSSQKSWSAHLRSSPDKFSRQAPSQIWNLAHLPTVGDRVLMPRKKEVAIGEITGSYAYRTDLEREICGPHTIPVRWYSSEDRGKFDGRGLFRDRRTMFPVDSDTVDELVNSA